MVRTWRRTVSPLIVCLVVFVTALGPATPAVARSQAITADASPHVGYASYIEPGADGKLWFASPADYRIGSITTRGVVRTYTVRSSDTPPTSVAELPDGTVWFTGEYGGELIHVSLSTGAKLQSIDPGCLATNLKAAPDGSLWFGCAFVVAPYGAGVGHLTAIGQLVTFPMDPQQCSPPPGMGDVPIAINQAGNVWVGCDKAIAMFDATTGGTTRYRIPSLDVPGGIAATPDGSVWVTSTFNSTIKRRDPTTGKISTVASGSISFPEGIAAGTNGTVWFANDSNNNIGRVSLRGRLASFDAETEGSSAITLGPDGNVWYTGARSQEIGRITPSGRVTTFSG
jgi:streptogramin lyase